MLAGATTTAAAGVANLLTGGPQGLDPSQLSNVLYLAPAAGVLAATVTGLHLLLLTLPRTRRPWAGLVVALGSAAWVAWMGWWPLNDSGPLTRTRWSPPLPAPC